MIQTIKLNKLRLSPINVRTAPDEQLQIEPMAASIEAKGVLQNLLVTPAKKPRGTFEVFDGGRRWRALRLLSRHHAHHGAHEWQQVCRNPAAVGPCKGRKPRFNLKLSFGPRWQRSHLSDLPAGRTPIVDVCTSASRPSIKKDAPSPLRCPIFPHLL